MAVLTFGDQKDRFEILHISGFVLKKAGFLGLMLNARCGVLLLSRGKAGGEEQNSYRRLREKESSRKSITTDGSVMSVATTVGLRAVRLREID